MDMPIDQTGTDIFAVQINFFPAVIRTHAHDRISADGNVSGVDLIGKHIDDSGIFQNQIGQSISSACRDPAFQLIRLHRKISSLKFDFLTCGLVLPLFYHALPLRKRCRETKMAPEGLLQLSGATLCALCLGADRQHSTATLITPSRFFSNSS